MVDTLELDWEGRAETDLIKTGLDRYSSDPTAHVFMGAYALNGGEFKHWEAHKRAVPAELKEALLDPAVEKWAFNAQFERVITRRVLKIPTPYAGWRCTMVLASLQSFPGGLEQVGERVGLPLDKQKLKSGKRLINLFCKPQKITKANPHVWRDWDTDPEEWEEFCSYNIQDCEAERAIRKRLIRFRPPAVEWELYELDQRINDRGMPIDRLFATNAIWMAKKRKDELTAQMVELTGLKNPGSTPQLLPWLRERGYPFRDIQKNTVTKVLTTDKVSGGKLVTDDCRAVLLLRQWQARMATTKYNAMVNNSGDDDRLRYTYQMAGAARTGRWAGRTPQLHNLVSTPRDYKRLEVLNVATDIIRAGNYSALDVFTDEPMEVMAGLVRSGIRAPDDYELQIVDLKSIESAMIGLLCNCKALLDVFRHGLDPYKDFAADFYGIPYSEVSSIQRNICKPPVLGCGYRLGGGNLWGGKRTGLWGYAEGMGVDISQQEAHRAVKVFRDKYEEIPEMWPKLENAIERTLKTKRDTTVGLLRFEHRKPYLLMWLPGGKRAIHYFKPQLKWTTINTGKTVRRKSRGLFEDGWPEGEFFDAEETYEKLSFTYMGKQQNGQTWLRINSHGGKTIEQATQGSAREVFAHGMLQAGRAKYPLIGHTHDELIGLVKKGSNRHTLEDLRRYAKTPVPGFEGLPLDAAGFTTQYYRKD